MDDFKLPVSSLRGIGPVKAAAFSKLNLRTLEDLLYHYPRGYENRGDVVLLEQAAQSAEEAGQTGAGKKRATVLTISKAPRVARIRRGMDLLKMQAFDESGFCEITFFNQNYLRTLFCVGQEFRFFGAVERQGRNFKMANPAFELYTADKPLISLFPVYPLSTGISQKLMHNAVTEALQMLLRQVEDPLPETIRAGRGLCTLSWAIEKIHNPQTIQDVVRAKRRLAYDEFFLFSLYMARSQKRIRRQGAPVCRGVPIEPFLARLPYALTGAQERVLEEIRGDMESGFSMNRILIGDVGSGKTVCAAAAMYLAVKSGMQAALMAPTEILAQQHFKDLSELFSGLGIRTALLTGSVPAAQKRKVYQGLACPDPDKRIEVVIGTQALLSDGVDFSSLGLVVADEQHRFGVMQRTALYQKNASTHVLMMSATPIPRSLALAFYGNLDVSKLDQMPPGRQRVDTYVVDESYHRRLVDFMDRQIEEGGQTYIVCPSIEDQTPDPDDDGQQDLRMEDIGSSEPDKPALQSAVRFAARLKEELPNRNVALIHGKMKQAEKDRVMQAFVLGQVHVLVSTTVIEVGVNVPNANVMMVENAERFGLSQLHQLRGRVGRGTRKSYCILVQGGEAGHGLSENARKRLETMRTTYDGYQIAEQDLSLRGPGDFFAMETEGGVRQSGGFAFKMGALSTDRDLFELASADAAGLLAGDPELKDHPDLLVRCTDQVFVSD
ncbi:MAG: ATP-dependent DNA helicase RecG [Clostridia bacterium]|nr:ATP-dependent DNA helicase RecG [Clostridia bacterium]